jgi:hypothetical protein
VAKDNSRLAIGWEAACFGKFKSIYQAEISQVWLTNFGKGC